MTVKTELKAASTTAFISSPKSLIINDGDPQKEPQFILNTHRYKTIQLYVTARLELVKDKTAYKE